MKPGTDKVNAARKRKSVKILWISWFLDCVSEWKRLPPTGKYRMTFEEDDAYVTAENPSSDGADPNGHAPADDEEEEAEEDEAHPNQVTHDMEFWEDIDKEVDDFLNESEDDEDEDDSDTGSMHLE
jgi:RNA polymerase II subunit A-like phosphatase